LMALCTIGRHGFPSVSLVKGHGGNPDRYRKAGFGIFLPGWDNTQMQVHNTPPDYATPLGQHAKPAHRGDLSAIVRR